jgi:nucleotide-binding universal stress UspA family protein
MAIKSILAPVTGYEKSEGWLTVALKLARRLGARIDVLHVGPDPRDAIPLMTEGAGGAMMTRIIESAEEDAATRASTAEKLFKTACKKAGVALGRGKPLARYDSTVGRAPGEVMLRARVHDLVLFGRAPEAGEIDWRLTFEAALLEGGRPILLLPAKPREIAARSVAIAWNGGVQAAHAARDALPFLAKAKSILLLAGAREDPVEPSLDALAGWLGRHGISAKVKQVALKTWPVGDGLVAEAARAGADFLVMGGYGHSRMRETVFGGATRAVVNDSSLPVLMSH